MARISLKEQYDNKDVITQIYDIRDSSSKAVDDSTQALTTANEASANATQALATVGTASDKADAAQAKADAVDAKITVLEPKVDKNTSDISHLEISDTEHTDEITTLQNNVSTHATEIAAIKAKDVQQDSSIQGLSESVVSDLTGSFDNTSRNLSLIIEREAAASIDFVVNIPASGETGQYAQGKGITISNNQISADIDGTNLTFAENHITVNTDNIPTKTYVQGVYATKSSVQNIEESKQNKITTTTVLLTTTGWNNLAQTVSVTGMTADSIVWVSPQPADFIAYGKAGVYASAQGTGTITFRCNAVPSTNVTVNLGVTL